LTDLAIYLLYYSTASTQCPQSSFFQVASPTPSPQINETVTYGLTGLWTGARYFVAVTAVDSGGLESACSPVANAVARSAGNTTDQLSGSPANTGASEGSPFPIQLPVSTLSGLTAESGRRRPAPPSTFPPPPPGARRPNRSSGGPGAVRPGPGREA